MTVRRHNLILAKTLALSTEVTCRGGLCDLAMAPATLATLATSDSWYAHVSDANDSSSTF